jgi:hypothetical protein
VRVCVYERNGTCTNAVIATESQNKLSLSSLLCHAFVDLLAALSHCIAVLHVVKMPGIAFGVISARCNVVNITRVLHLPAQLRKLFGESSFAEHAGAVVSALPWLAPSHGRSDYSALPGLDKEARMGGIGMMHLPYVCVCV